MSMKLNYDHEDFLMDLPDFVHRLSDKGITAILNEASDRLKDPGRSSEGMQYWTEIVDIILDEVIRRQHGDGV